MQNKKISLIFVLLAASLWGTAGIFVRNLQGQIGNMTLVFARTLFASAIFGVLILIKDKKLFRIKIKDLPFFLLGGLCSIVLFSYSYYTTISLTSLSVAAVLMYTAPIFVVIISAIFFHARLTLQKCAACLVAFLGCCFVSGLFDAKQNIGAKAIFFGLVTGLGYALYTIFGDVLIRRGYETLTITFYVFLSAVIGSMPFVRFAEEPNLFSAKPLLIIFLMAIFNTVLPYLFYTSGLKGVESTTAPIIATLEPVVATLIGMVFFHEKLSFLGAVGILLVLGSVCMINTKIKKEEPVR